MRQEEIKKDPAQALEVAIFEKGQEILPEGDESPFFFVILSGRAMLRRNGTTIRTLGEQDIFGLERLLLKMPSHYSARATQECRVARYGSEAFEYLIETPRMIRNVLISLLQQLRQTALNLDTSPEPFITADGAELLPQTKNVHN